MKRTTKIKWGELKVGILLAIAVVVLIWASFSGGGTSIFDRKTGYVSYFKNVNGLVVGSPVWVAGIEVGNVYSIKFVNLDEERQVEIKFRVLTSVTNMVTTDATIKLGTIGFIGDKYVELVPGSYGNPVLPEGSTITVVSAGDLASVFAEGEEVMATTKDLTTSLSMLTERVSRGEGSVGKMFTEETLYDEMTGLVASLTVLINDMQKSQKRIVSSLESLTGNVDEIAEKANKNEGTIGKLLSDPGLYDNIHASSGRIDSILAKINAGRGTAGAMVNDDELYEEVKNLIVRIENLVTDIEENPRKYFKFSVF